MISPRFDFDFFVASVKDLGYEEIRRILREEIRATDEATGAHVRGAPAARIAGGGQYAELLRGLHFILDHGRRPSNVPYDWELARMRPVIEGLVNKGAFRPTILSIF
jgi:hypothetical protein